MNFKPYYTNLWILANPFIMYRTLRGFFRAFVLKKNTLKTIELYPTFECQSLCKMCSVKKYKKVSGDLLELDDYRSIAQQGARMGAIAMTLLGGEPLLAKETMDIIRIFKSHHYFITMVSNSIGLTKEYVKKLRSIGLNSIYFSLESLNEKINDEIRGYPGHYRSVMSSIDICKSESLQVGLCGVIFPRHIDRYIELIEFCKKNNLLASGGEVAAIGAAVDEQLNSDEEHQQILALLKKYPRLTFDWALSYFLKPRCPGGKEKIGITCYGDVIGCSLNPISFGNIKNDSLEIIWKRMGRFSQFKNDCDGCLTAYNRQYIYDYIVPICDRDENPIFYKEHPNITPEKEPELFSE